MPVDHFALTVPEGKLDELVTFLTTSLAHMGFKEHFRPVPHVVGLGEERPYFWINTARTDVVDEGAQLALIKHNHIAFTAKDSEQVQKFYDAAMKAGGIDNGAPGMRPQYHPNYYGAFVKDPVVGLNFEVVCHTCST